MTMPTTTSKYWLRGEMGDIIYALSFIKHTGGGELSVAPMSAHGNDQVAALAPLIAKQPYVTKFEAPPSVPQVAINAGEVDDLRLRIDSGGNVLPPVIIRPYWDKAGLPFPAYSPWLEGIAPHTEDSEYCVVNTTHRYRDDKHI